MSPDTWPNLATMFFEQAATGGERPFLWSKHADAYRPQSWRRVAEEVSALSRGFRAAGVVAGDRVALVSENRPNWAVVDLAVMAAGAVTVPAYTTNTADDHRHVLADSGARAAVVSTPTLAARLFEAAADAPELRFIVAMEPPPGPPPGKIRLLAWNEILAAGRKQPDDTREVAGGLRRDDLACLMYTSGTGGRPKGVMLSHGAILANCRGAFSLFDDMLVEDETFLCFLPLSHSYERTCGLYFPVFVRAQIYYVEGAETLMTNFVEARPTIMTCVPRLYELVRGRMLHDLAKGGALRQALFRKALELGRRKYEAPGSLRMVERAVDALVERLVRAKVRARFGGRLKAFISGGAALNYEVGLFFTALGLRLLQGYGQTETAPVVSCNHTRGTKLHTVGPPVEGAEVKIAEDGEILVRGELVMKGYWNDPEATAEVLRDGWLHTGDIGLIDEDGHIQVTDRKKEIIVNSGGDNIAPQRVEGILMLEPEIAQAMVFGEQRPHLVGLIVPDEGFLESFAAESGRAPELASLAEDAAFREAIGRAVARANEGLSVIEQVRRFAVAPEPFRVDNGLMTPTLKIRRHRILARYRSVLEALY
ncbi:MAG: AMP-dependent synthetase/ligase [Alphaproteobacteria bacterium]